jgi:hypothetical protein
MNRAIHMMAWDLSLQLRHHILTANIASTAFICGFIAVLPFDPLPTRFASFMIFADPALIGLGFVGAMVLMEKATRVHLALGVTPSPPWVYLVSKTVTLTVSGTLSGLAVALVARRGDFDFAAMAGALLLCNAFAVLLGFGLVARSRSMNDMMIRLLYASTVLFFPLLPHFGIGAPLTQWMAAAIPSSSMLVLLQHAIDPGGLTTPIDLAAIAYLSVGCVVAFAWSLREYRASVVSEGR